MNNLYLNIFFGALLIFFTGAWYQENKTAVKKYVSWLWNFTQDIRVLAVVLLVIALVVYWVK